MILPTKGIAAERALISLGGNVLRLLDGPKTVSRLWDDFNKLNHAAVTFDWFVLSLDLLFVLGAVEFEHGRVQQAGPAGG